MGQKETKTPAADTASERYKRASKRKHKKDVSEAVTSLLSLKKRRIDFEAYQNTTTDNDSTDISELGENDSHMQQQDEEPQLQLSNTHHRDAQTYLTLDGLKQIEDDNKLRMLEAKEKSATESRIYQFQTYTEDPEKVPFYTGLPNLGVLKLVFEMVENQMVSSSKTLSKEEEFLICLVKLRMNYLFKDIAYHLNVSVSTIQRSFHSTLDVMYARLQFLVKWPTRENLRKSMPDSVSVGTLARGL